MNRATFQTLIGVGVAAAAGFAMAYVIPAKQSSKPVEQNATVAAGAGGSSTAPAETALARVVRTEKGSQRWLIVLAQADKATAEQMPAIIRSVGNDSAMIRMLAARWAELDPSHMFASLYADLIQPDGAPGTLPSRWELTSALFEQWVKKDADGVIKALNGVPDFSGRDSLRMTVFNQLLQVDVEKGLLAMKEWNIRNYVPNMKSLADWAARDPRRAAETIASLDSEYVVREAMKHVGKAWAQSDPESGLRYAMSLNARTRASLASEVIGTWAQRDLSAAVKFVSAEDNPALKAAVAQGLVNEWAKTDAAGALKWSEENLRGAARTEAIGSLVKTVSVKDIEAAGDLVAGMEPGAAQNSACASIFETWFKKGKEHRDAAFAWLAELPDPRARQIALEKVQWDWAWNDPDGARDFISGPYGSLASPSLIHQVARGQAAKNPEAAMNWAASLPKERVEDARRAVLDNWLQVRPEGAASYVLKLPAGTERDAAIGRLSQNFIYTSGGIDHAIEWFGKLSESDRNIARDSIKHIQLDPERKRRVDEVLNAK